MVPSLPLAARTIALVETFDALEAEVCDAFFAPGVEELQEAAISAIAPIPK